MPRIPDKYDLGKVGSFRSGRARVTARDVDTSAKYRGLNQIGAAISGIGQQLQARDEKAQKEEDALDLLRAETEYQKSSIGIDRSLEADPDYASHDQRFAEQSIAARDRAAGLIRNPQARERWKLKNELDIARQRTSVVRRADRLGKQKRAVELEDDLEERLRIYSSPDTRPDERQEARGGIDTAIQLAERSGLATPSQARKLRKKYLLGAEVADVERRLIDDPAGLLGDLSRGSGDASKAASDSVKAAITARLETGESDPLKGVSNISRDAGGTKSYGNFGLNSQKGGSIFAFAKKYAKELGLKGEPGTPAFDKSWKKVSKDNPDGLHAAEMEWYSSEITADISERLTNVGASESIANDPRVQAYFSDRSVQQGTGSIDSMRKHADRILFALDDADNTDPVEFLKSITERDREALYEDFPTALKSGVYSPRGHDNRLDNRLNMSLGLGQSDAYPELSPLQRAEYTAAARKAIRSSSESMRNQFKQMLEDDVESMRRTGEGVRDFDLSGAKGVLDKSQISRWEVARTEAAMEYEGLNDIPTLTNSEMTKRLADLRPAQGEPGFEMRAKIYDKGRRQIERIQRERQTDPAKSVDELPAIVEAKQILGEMPGDPAALQNLVRARLDAQDQVGIPTAAQDPITVQEARVMASRLKGLEGKALHEAMVPFQQDLRDMYGPYASAVSISVVSAITRDRELAEAVDGIIQRTFRGEEASASIVRKAEILQEGVSAERVFGGEYVGSPFAQFNIPGAEQGLPMVPAQTSPGMHFGFGRFPARAVELLKSNPSLASKFDEKYGPGSAAMALTEPDITPQPEIR